MEIGQETQIAAWIVKGENTMGKVTKKDKLLFLCLILILTMVGFGFLALLNTFFPPVLGM